MLNYTKANALAELDTLTPANIQRSNKRFLLDRCNAIGIETVKRGAKFVPVSEALKSELATAILTALQAPRDTIPDASALVAVTEAELTELNDTPDVWYSASSVADTYFAFIRKQSILQRDHLRNVWKPPSNELANCGARLAIALASLKRSDNGEQLAVTSKLTFRRDVFSRLTALVENERGQWYFDTLTDNIAIVRDIVHGGMSELAREKKTDDSKRLNERKEDVATIDPTQMIANAKAILSLIDEFSPATLWLQVSCALAVATGRRMAEIHSTATFTAIDSHSLHFTGQAKAKGETADKSAKGFVIPTLVDAQLCVNALQWLTDNGKRVADTSTVNTRYSKALSQYVKKFYDSAMPSLYAEHESKCTYHKLRAIYGLCAVRSFRPANMQDVRYLGDIMGHDQDASVSDRYTADFRIADGATTHF